MSTTAPTAKIAQFPASATESCLRDELVEAIKAEATIKGIALPPSSAELTKATVPIDSLVVVSILCAVESIVGFEIPDSVVRSGGYGSIEKALEHLIPQIEKQWMKQKGAKS